MTLDVDAPDPPELQETDPEEYDDVEVTGNANYRRQDLEQFLKDGAWADAFDEWRGNTDMDEAEFEIARDLGLFREFDFFWDDFADRVGYHAPGIPEDWRERDYHPDLDSWGTVSAINAGLTELGQVVSEVLKQDFVDWEAEYDSPDDLPDFD
ncbi:hypothetical protein [Halostella sp. PRR32]|uniref:hypothetical protein n=1 Tax=Halostella sp. PRR32 TaxID=3098147 RepID=UPI002B1D8001|nr:hypothetical protein [Halostella sp. PRR32]